MSRRIDRFDRYMKAKGLNDNRVTVQLGLSVGVLGKSRKEGRDLSSKATEKILAYYSDINRVWLLAGEGDMLVSDKLDYPEGISGYALASDLVERYETKEIELDELSIKLLIALERRDMEYFKLMGKLDRLIETLEKTREIDNKE
jgi:hypothetical protein